MERSCNSSSQSGENYLRNFCATEAVLETTLSNGLRIFLKQDTTAPVLSIQVWVKTGSIHEGEYGGSGLSHYLEHMLFKGTHRHSYASISKTIEALGGFLNAYTYFDHTVYHIEGPSALAETAITLLGDILFNTTFPYKEVLQERSVILREIDMVEDCPESKLNDLLFATALRDHPYSYPIIGHSELFERLGRPALLDYYQTRYTPQNMAVIGVSNLGIEPLKLLIQNTFGKPMRSVTKPIIVPPIPPQLEARAYCLKGAYNVVRGAFAYHIPGLKDPATPKWVALNQLLGQGDSSFLFQELREKKAYIQDISTYLWQTEHAGLFIIYYVCNTGKQDLCRKAIQEALDRFFSLSISPKEMEKAYKKILIQAVNSKKSMEAQAAQIGLYGFLMDSLNLPFCQLQAVAGLKESAILSLQNYFSTQNQTSVTLEPLEKRKPASLERVKKLSAQVPHFETITLKNGVQLNLEPNKVLPKIHIHTGFLGGGIWETPRTRGLTSLMATMLTKDTKNYSAKALAERFENSAIEWGEFAGNNTFGITLEALSSDLSLCTELLAEMLLRPAFKEKTFLRERTAQISLIQEDLDDLEAHGLRMLRRQFFGENHPYASDPLGELDSLESLQVLDVQNHWECLQHIHPAVVSITGDFSQKAFLNAIQFLEQLPVAKTPFASPRNAQPSGIQAISTVKLNKEQTFVFEAYPAPGIRAEDSLYFDVLEDILNSPAGPLFTDIREIKGLAYTVGAGRIMGVGSSMLYLFAGTECSQTKAVLGAFEGATEQLCASKNLEEHLQAAKNRLRSTQAINMQSPAFRAAQATLWTLYGYGPNYFRTYEERLHAIRAKDFTKTIQAYIQQKNRTQLLCGNVL